MTINTVKIIGHLFLVNGTHAFDENYEPLKQWLAEGNTPEPEFTEAELAQQVLDKSIAEAKVYLASTDFKMTVDYYSTLTPEQQEELTVKRAEARAFLKEQGL